MGEICLEEEKVDGLNSANLQIACVCDSVYRKEQMKAETYSFFVLFSLLLRLNLLPSLSDFKRMFTFKSQTFFTAEREIRFPD